MGEFVLEVTFRDSPAFPVVPLALRSRITHALGWALSRFAVPGVFLSPLTCPPATCLLKFVLLHQVPEGAIGDSEHVGGFGLYAVGLLQRSLQQRALDLGDVFFHAEPLRQDGAGPVAFG